MKIMHYPVHLTGIEKHLREESVTVGKSGSEVTLSFDSPEEAYLAFEELVEFPDKLGHQIIPPKSS